MSPVENFALLFTAGASSVVVPLVVAALLASVIRAAFDWFGGGGEK